ncbi:hypothetical protein GCM10009619_42540 [Williamsia maris]|uniref:DUF2530 domain-containing protein n=2 Tax=Williamsia maris TaxID=72806 RepID=A0ABT1HJQ4_9NOCA|nr:hypothetical protein [Williamsia maris]
MAVREPKDTSRPGFLAYLVMAVLWLAVAALSWFGARNAIYGRLAAIAFVVLAAWCILKALRIRTATAQTTQ